MDRHRKSPWVPESGSWEGGRGEAVAASSVQAGQPASPWSTTARPGVRLSVRPCPRSRPSWEHREPGAVLLAPGRSADLAATSLLQVHAGPRAVSELLRCTHPCCAPRPQPSAWTQSGWRGSPLSPLATKDQPWSGWRDPAAGRGSGRERARGGRREGAGPPRPRAGVRPAARALEQGRDCSPPHAHRPRLCQPHRTGRLSRAAPQVSALRLGPAFTTPSVLPKDPSSTGIPGAFPGGVSAATLCRPRTLPVTLGRDRRAGAGPVPRLKGWDGRGAKAALHPSVPPLSLPAPWLSFLGISTPALVSVVCDFPGASRFVSPAPVSVPPGASSAAARRPGLSPIGCSARWSLSSRGRATHLRPMCPLSPELALT